MIDSPRALMIERNSPAEGSTLPVSMREIYDFFAPTRSASSCCVMPSALRASRMMVPTQ